jgi:plasmid stabilization system protein ParE
MTYRIAIPEHVDGAIVEQARYLISKGAPRDRIAAWHDRVYNLIDSLERMPRRFPVAEKVSAAKGFEVRRANFGEYAIFYRVHDEHQLVEVVSFRHGRRKPWLEDEPSET